MFDRAITKNKYMKNEIIQPKKQLCMYYNMVVFSCSIRKPKISF